MLPLDVVRQAQVVHQQEVLEEGDHSPQELRREQVQVQGVAWTAQSSGDNEYTEHKLQFSIHLYYIKQYFLYVCTWNVRAYRPQFSRYRYLVNFI